MKLIATVSNFPLLNDFSLPTYRDINHKNDVWKIVSNLVGIPSGFDSWIYSHSSCLQCDALSTAAIHLQMLSPSEC